MNPASDVQIRKARPSDAPFLAWVMQEADRMGGPVGSLDLVFDMDETSRLEILGRLTVSAADSYFHYRRFLVAEVDGLPVAALSGYVPGELPPHSYATVSRREMRALGWSDGDIERVIDGSTRFRGSAFFHVPVPDDTLVIEWMATRPASRRRGLIASLLGELLARARSQGRVTAHVGTAIGNEPAIRAYQSAGFEIYAEARHADYESLYAAPGLIFFRRDLNDEGG